MSPILPPAIESDLSSLREKVLQVERENRVLRLQNEKLANENNELCDQIFELNREKGRAA